MMTPILLVIPCLPSQTWLFLPTVWISKHEKLKKVREESTAHLSNGQRTKGPEAARPTAAHTVYMPLRGTHLIDFGLPLSPRND